MTKPGIIRLAVFDCDGTMVDSQHNIIAAMRAAFADSGHDAPTDDAIRRIVGLSLDEAVTTLAPGAPANTVAMIIQGYKDSFGAFRRRPEYHEPLYPGIEETLNRLSGDGFMLAVATGKSRRGLTATLDRHDLLSFFDVLQTADDAPGKPHPGMLEQAMTETGAAPEETVLIGDTVFDVAMAHSAGASSIGVSWGYHGTAELSEAGAHEIVRDWEQLVPAVKRLTGA